MPRDSGGTYVLPAGNPVVSGTIIQSAWANDTMGDMGNEMTDSLSRTGNGGMLAPLRHINGSEGGPAITFINDPTSGRYLVLAGEYRDSVASTDVAVYTSTGVEFLVPVTLSPIFEGDVDLALDAAIRGQRADFSYENLLTLNSVTNYTEIGNILTESLLQALAVIELAINGSVVATVVAAGLDVTGNVRANNGDLVSIDSGPTDRNIVLGNSVGQAMVTGTATGNISVVTRDAAGANAQAVLIGLRGAQTTIYFSGSPKLDTRTDGVNVTGALFENGVQNISATAANVGAAIAGIAYNGIGAYALAYHTANVAVAPNATVAGSALTWASTYSDKDGDNGGGSSNIAAGTWRAMGACGGANGGNAGFEPKTMTTLWLRIA